MSVWGQVFAATYDRLMAGTEEAGLTSLRRDVLSHASGRVLEIGAGTGANVALYPADVQLVLSEPFKPMAMRLRRRVATERRFAKVVQAPGDELPFDDASFDAIVTTLVLCTVPDPHATLAEIRRVLRPSAPLLLVEHVRSDRPDIARWQDRIHPFWRRFGHGCHCNRDTLAILEQEGFATGGLEHGLLPKAPFWIRSAVWGAALPVTAANGDNRPAPPANGDERPVTAASGDERPVTASRAYQPATAGDDRPATANGARITR